MAKEILKYKEKFFAGQVRDDKSEQIGAWSNLEEIDIFTNSDFVQAEQILSAESLPANTEIYAYDTGDDDTVYTYGRRTDATAGTVRLMSVASGGGSDPGNLSTLFTSADTTNLATRVGDMKFFRSSEASNPTSLYYIQGTGSSWYLSRYNIGAGAEQTWNGSAWVAGTANASSQLTGLSGSFDRPTMKIIYGELLICHGQFVAKIDKDAVFTLKAWTAPNEWQGIDIIPVSDIALILARNKNRLVNYSKGFWWDLTNTTQFEDSFTLPIGGPQWIYNHKETIKMLCAINGIARIFQLSGAFPGAVPLELPGIGLTNIGTETSTRPISMPKMVSTKDRILYFGLLKTDKTGIYGLGQLDSDKPNALILSKRFNTTNYANHRPTALLVHGPNFYAAYDDNGTETAMRCETLNSPSRSSNATMDDIWQDGNLPLNNKQLKNIFIATKKLTSGTSLAISVASDYDDTFTSVTRANGTAYNTTNALIGKMLGKSFANKKAFKVRIAFTSSTTNSPQLQGVGYHILAADNPAND